MSAHTDMDVLATAHCGCRAQRPISTTTIQLAMCPLHAAAPELLEALRQCADCMFAATEYRQAAATAAYAAIRKATEE